VIYLVRAGLSATSTKAAAARIARASFADAGAADALLSGDGTPTMVAMSEIDFLVGQTVVELRYPANGLRVVFDAGERVEPALYADIEEAFAFTDGSGEIHQIRLDEPSTLASVLSIAGQTVVAVSTDDAVLDLSFADGSSLRCDPHPEYEAWQVVGGSPQRLVVCVEPGELAVWDDSSEANAIGLDELLGPKAVAFAENNPEWVERNSRLLKEIERRVKGTWLDVETPESPPHRSTEHD
jgi:Family of unknown function (DUF6188)